MGMLKVRGTAEMAFVVDIFNIKITVHSTASSSGEVIQSGKKKTEKFLRLMKEKLDIEPNDFELEADSVSSSYNSDKSYSYKKNLSLVVNADLSLLSKITSLLEDMSDVTYDVDFCLSDKASKEKQVIEAAIKKSREKAEMIASSLGQKVLGVDEVSYEHPSDVFTYNLAKSVTVEDRPDMEAMLKNPTETITKHIYISWIIE